MTAAAEAARRTPPGPEPEEAAVAQLRRLGWTLGVAESVTAGGLTARLARVPGVSDILRGGLVVYATDTKVALAGVDESLLRTQGPVAEEVVRRLAEAARDRLQADVGLAVVGVAGPTEQGGQPVGTVRVAVVVPGGEVLARRFDLGPQERVAVQDAAVRSALELLSEALHALAPPAG